MEFENSKHMFYYLRKIFNSNKIPMPVSSTWFEEKCDLIFRFYEQLKDAKRPDLQIFVGNFKNRFSFKIYELATDTKSSDEIEYFVDFFIEQLHHFMNFILYEKDNQNLDLDFAKKYFCDELMISKLYDEKVSEEFEKEYLQYAMHTTGIYFLYNEKNELLYIGKSANLFSRMSNSLRERKATKYRYALCKSKAEMHLYEVYYILKMKPLLNVDCSDSDELTIELPDLSISEMKNAFENEGEKDV